jgi:hypothetical protein
MMMRPKVEEMFDIGLRRLKQQVENGGAQLAD